MYLRVELSALKWFAGETRKRDVTTMFTYSHANTPRGQSERAYYLMHLSMLSRRGGRQGIGRGFDRHSWPVGRAFDRFSCPRGRIIWFFCSSPVVGLFLPYGWKRLVSSRLFPLCACDVDVLEAWTERKRCVNLIYFFVLLSHVWLYDFACVMKHVTDPAMYINRTCRQFLAVILIVQDNRVEWFAQASVSRFWICRTNSIY